MLFRYQGYVSAALVLGGVDIHGPHLYTVYPHGSTDRLPFVSMGSGSLAAMAVFESNFTDDMSLDAAKKLVYEAISAGIYNDLGSGGNVDLCVITSDGCDSIRPYASENERKFSRPDAYRFPAGTTPVVAGSSTFTKPVQEFAVISASTPGDTMDVSA